MRRVRGDGKMRELVRALRRQGWLVQLRANNHWEFHSPDRRTVLFSSGTPSDWRTYKNLRAQLRRAGAKV